MELPAKPGAKYTNNSNSIPFLSMTKTRLLVLSFMTFGLYELYWFYKNWQAIKTARQLKVWPFWRAVFSIFFALSLFKQVLEHAKKRRYRKSYSASWLALAYGVSVLIGNGLARYPEYDLGVSVLAVNVLILGVLPLLPVQDAINFSITGSSDTIKPYKKTKGEVVFIIIGVIIGILVMLAYFVPDSTSITDTPEFQQAKTRMDDLTDQYNVCSADLNLRESRVDTTSQFEVDRYNNDLQACEDIRLEQNRAVDVYNALIGE